MCSAGNKVFSKLCQGKEIILLWEIKNWRIKDDSDFDLLTRNISYTLDVVGREIDEGVTGESCRKASLRFYFDQESIAIEGTEEFGPRVVEHHSWLRLNVDQLSNLGNQIVQYEFKVDLVNDKLNGANPDKSVLTCKDHGAIKKLPLHSKVVYLQQDLLKKDGDGSYFWDQLVLPRPESVKLKISVIPIYMSTSSAGDQGTHESISSREASLCKAMKNMFTDGQEVYPDIKLETNDNIVLDSHRFMLAARSPFLQRMIDKKVKEDGFNGMIKLEEVNAKPMITILHWMYTGELHDNIAKFMEEVVDAAIRFGLTDLLKILDEKLITICNRDNMFQLYQIAKENGMLNGAAEISKFIKDNLE